MAKLLLTTINVLGLSNVNFADVDEDNVDHVANGVLIFQNTTGSPIDVVIPTQNEYLNGTVNSPVIISDITVTIAADSIDAVSVPPAYTGLKGRIDVQYPNSDGVGLRIIAGYVSQG